MDAGEISRGSQNNEAVAVNPFSGADVAEVLSEHGWNAAIGPETRGSDAARAELWDRAAFLLGPQVADRAGLADLLGLVFEYDAARALSDVEAHNVMTRYAA